MKRVRKLKSLQNIGLVCQDGTKISVIVAYLLRNHAIKSSNKIIRNLRFWNAGIERQGKIKDSTKGFLQKKGYSTSSMADIERISNHWLKHKDLILTSDRFVKRKIVYDYTGGGQDLAEKTLTIKEFINGDTDLRDPGDEASSDNQTLFTLIEEISPRIIQELEKME